MFIDIGRKVVVKSLECIGEIKLPAQNNGDNPVVVRVVFYVDHQTNGAATLTGELFQDNDFFSFLNLSQGKRFTIIYDKVIKTAVNGGAGSSAPGDLITFAGDVVIFRFKKKLNLPVMFSSTGVNIANITSNNISMMVITNGTTGPGALQQAGVAARLRIRYKDS